MYTPVPRLADGKAGRAGRHGGAAAGVSGDAARDAARDDAGDAAWDDAGDGADGTAATRRGDRPAASGSGRGGDTVREAGEHV